jgi:hypothetical protein
MFFIGKKTCQSFLGAQEQKKQREHGWIEMDA